jgi:hypothetical protein
MKLYQTVLDVGTQAAIGKTTDLDVAQAIMDAFATLNVKQANNGPVLTYWNEYYKTQGRQTTRLLLQNHDGSCVGWSQFFLDTLEAQGVTGGLMDLVQSAGNMPQEGLLVKQWDAGPANNTDPRTNKPGQYPYVDTLKVNGLGIAGPLFVQTAGKWGYGWDATKSSVLFNADPTKYLNAQGESARAQPPLALFANHVVAEITISGQTILFDSSYGKQYALPGPLGLNDPITALDAAIPYFWIKIKDPLDPAGARYLIRKNTGGLVIRKDQLNYAQRLKFSVPFDNP